MRGTILVALLCATFAGEALRAGNAHAVRRTGREFNTLYAGLGIKGYDPVAYFTDGVATPGRQEFMYEWGGVKWLFASREHRDAFSANPMKYAPQYGGFCAWGVSQGKLFDVDPERGWKIVDGKLYMNFNSEILATWSQDIPGFVRAADTKWPELDL
jgi:YHS domain-containing protein